MPKVSVIIPVYNARDYLARCLDSVCNQTLQDIEIIAVDDCSTDDSLDILHQYAEKYPQLRVIHHEKNGGESRARNTGLDNATGEYLAFVDNDDTIDLNFYEKLYTQAKTENADIAKGEVHEISYDGKEFYSNLNGLIKNNGSKLYFTYYWWTAIYKTSLIKENNIRLPNGFPLGGDALFLNQAILKTNKLALVENTFYNYYRREDSGDSKVLPLNKIRSVLDIHDKILENTISSNAIKTDPTGISNICFWCIDAALHYAYRNRSLEGLKECINAAFRFYKKSEPYLLMEQMKTLPVIFKYLSDEDPDGLYNFYIENNSPSKMFTANLRYLHNKRSSNA